MTTVYGIVFAVALLMIGVYFFVDRKRDIWLMLLFVSIAVCDAGYFLLSASKSLEAAMWSNRLAYLGSVFLPFFMLMMIMNLSRFKYPKFLPKLLIALNTAMFLIAASGGILPIYYKDVSLGCSDGAAYLIKEYGPLHNLYKVFLFAYFAAMVVIIIYTAVKKIVVSTKHSVFLAFVVIGNIATWLVENMIGAGFEFLSISYIFSESLILFLYGILQDYGLADTQRISDSAVESLSETSENITASETVKSFSKEQIENIFNNWKTLDTLSQREKEVLGFILENKKRKDIAETLFVTESTIKKHTSAIFRKLEITNRAELFEKAKEYLYK
ncbi:MAG: hypothetical protein IKJ41_12110 [Clostridia bacterium]|nr:hypothetical protein [Clostridia bacterium]